MSATEPEMSKWPRIAVLVGGSVTVSAGSEHKLQASDPIKFWFPLHSVNGIPKLQILFHENGAFQINFKAQKKKKKTEITN